MQPGEMNVDPIEGEFFSTEALDSLADALVRESIQNSLDARRESETLHVRFAFSNPQNELEGEAKARYLEGLMPHVRATQSGLLDLPSANEELSFLAIEDFGTRGLQGDPAQSEDEELNLDVVRNDFYYFWRNVGRSRKHAAELGRWGLGKTVFPAASRVNSFFGMTVRSNDQLRLLMGQSVAKVHKLQGQRHYPYGYYGDFKGDFALPINDAETLDAFGAAFGLARGSEPGLSVVVPYPSAEITPEALVPSIIHHYFLAIMAGVLTAEVVGNGKRVTLDAKSLPTLAHELQSGNREFEGLLRLARWSMDVPADQTVALDIPPEKEAPRWVDDRLSPEQLARLREVLDEPAPIALRAPVWVKPSAGDAVLSYFDVFLERDDLLARGDDHFIRDYITVAGVRASLPKGYRCIVAVRDRALATLLGDSENPAHTEWQERSPRFRDRYRHGPSTLRYIKAVPREVLRLLTRPAEGRDYGLLRQLFSLEIPEAAEAKDHAPQHDQVDGAGADAATSAEIVGREPFFQLQKLGGGFRLSGTGAEQALPAAIRVEVAYEVRRGNPFAHYQTLDFELDRSPIDLVGSGVEIVRRNENELLFRPEQNDFHVVITGFHTYRDLRVRVKVIEAVPS